MFEQHVTSLGLYIHIPFCQAKCTYCDFSSYAELSSLMEPYARALEAEMAWYAQRGLQRVDTIYVGGGTPTVLPLPLFEAVLEDVHRYFDVSPGAEFTVEANPGTVDRARMLVARSAGVTRLSLGVQSLRDEELSLLGRIHGADEAVHAYREARATGLQDISLDLIYGLPGQSMDDWQATVRQALALEPDHLSCYALSLEEGTPLQARTAAGDLSPPDEDLVADMYESAEAMLHHTGYDHYEISNWARTPAHVSRHNLRYWRYQAYLGLGAAAHSFRRGLRWWNVSHPEAYVARWALPRDTSGGTMSPAVDGTEPIGEGLAMAEMAILRLRLLKEGLREADFARQFERTLESVYGDEISALAGLGLLERTSEGVRLSLRGRLLANEVFERFLPRQLP